MRPYSLAPAVLAFIFLAPLPARAADPSPLPNQNAKDISPDTLLSLTFTSPPTLGTTGQVKIFDAADDKLIDTLDLSVPLDQQAYTIATVQFHAYPITLRGTTATIHPHNNLLTYGKTYYVQIDPGILSVAAAPFPGISGKTAWTFSTKSAPPPPPPAADHYTVAPDGTGDFATIQGAVDFLPAKNPKPVTLLLRGGTYTEILSIAGKSNIIFLGEDRDQTILTYANNEKLQLGNGSSSRRGVMNVIRSTGITLANLTIKNATPKGSGGNQAETIIGKSNSQIILTDVSLYSFQDTLQMSSPGYVANSYIEGDVDFMWGTGPCFFQDCQLKAVNNNDAFVVSRNPATNHGFVYLNCTFGLGAGVTGSILGNNQNYGNSEVVLLNCALAEKIDPVSWRGAGAAVHYWEYNSVNISDGKPADVSRRAPVSKRLDKQTDAETIANYGNPSFVLGGWTPALAPIITRQPEDRSVGAGQMVTLQVAAVGVPAAKYQWLKNGGEIAGATDATFRIMSPQVTDIGSYTVTAANVNGRATSKPVQLTVH